MGPDMVALSVLGHRLAGIAEQMGAVLERSACSPNIKERRDFSCAIFDGKGRLLAQAAHIPVHLGSMESSVRSAAPLFQEHPDDMIILNDPYSGGTHLPDMTVVAPLCSPAGGPPRAFVTNRAHHADVGGQAPGSLPARARWLDEEGLILPPTPLMRDGEPIEKVWQMIMAASHTPEERGGDLQAQVAAIGWGLRRLQPLVLETQWQSMTRELLSLSERTARIIYARVPRGRYSAREIIHDHREQTLELRVRITSDGLGGLGFDFQGTDRQYPGNLNAPPAVTRAAVNHVCHCLLQALEPEGSPVANHGAFAPLKLTIPPGCLLDPEPGDRSPAVSAGNVETSQRIVDLLLAALAPALPGIIPAQSQGTMNNLIIGAGRVVVPVSRDLGPSPSTGSIAPFAYYETLGGGCGATPHGDGASGTHSHMTNTQNTPVEALEHAYPLRVEAYRLRPGTGGHGQHQGGEGLERWVRLLAPSATLTFIGSRRRTQPGGLEGGGPGQPGEQWVQRDGQGLPLPAKTTQELQQDDVVVVRTPGGGGWSKTRLEG